MIRLALALAFCASAARADIVRLKFGDTFGQGWMFLDNDGVCKVVTAGHVVKGPDGRPRPMLVLDTNAREWTTGAPLLLSDDPDIAVVPVPAASNPSTCGNGRLSPIGVARRVADLTGAYIRTTGQSEQRDVPVTRRASVIDSRGGSVFAVAQTRPGEPFREGWSGSVVLDQQGPVGIVYEVSEKGDEAYAVRVDVIRDLMAAAPAPAAPTDPQRPTLTVDAGATIDPASGPDQILGQADGFWQVRPAKRSIVLDLQFKSPVQLSRVVLGLGWSVQNQVTAVDVSSKSAPDDPDWTWANYCKPEDELQAACRFLQRTVSSLRIRLQTRTDAPLTVRSLALQ